MKKTFPNSQILFAIIALFVPLFGSIFLYLSNLNFFGIFISFVILHLISTLPIEFFLAARNKWEGKKSKSKPNYSSFTHPRIYKHISLALLYPYIFIFLVLAIKYVNLGRINVMFSKFEYLLFIIFIITLIIANFSKCFSFFTQLVKVKEYLWQYTGTLVWAIYISLLRKNWFTRFMLYMHKTFFYFYRLLNLKSEVYWNFNYKKDFSSLRKILSHMVENDQIYTYLLGFIFSVEVIIYQKLYWFYYFSFLYFVLLYIWKAFVTLGCRNIYTEINLCDYTYRNFKNPRFPDDLVLQLNDPNFYFKFTQLYSLNDIIHIEKLVENYTRKNKKFLQISVTRRKLFYKVNNKKYHLALRIAAYYYYIYAFRF